MSLTFGQIVGKIEEVAIDLLFEGMKGYVTELSTYNGELGDRENLVKRLQNLSKSHSFPLVWVGYSGGDDVRFPDDGLIPNVPLTLQHQGTLIVACCCDDERSQYTKRRTGQPLTRAGGQALSHRMMSDVRGILANRQLVTRVDNQDVILNEGELIPLANDYIERITNVTAVAIPFSFYFNYTTTNTATPFPPVKEIAFEIDTRNNLTGQGGRPGVHINFIN